MYILLYGRKLLFQPSGSRQLVNVKRKRGKEREEIKLIDFEIHLRRAFKCCFKKHIDNEIKWKEAISKNVYINRKREREKGVLVNRNGATFISPFTFLMLYSKINNS